MNNLFTFTVIYKLHQASISLVGISSPQFKKITSLIQLPIHFTPSQLWNSTLSGSSPHWQRAEVAIGRLYSVKIVFEAHMDGENSDIALDDIQFIGCDATPLCSGNQFGCEEHSCLNRNQVSILRTRNRPNQKILVPDWLITSHVT
eukprot:sb/3473820/